MLIMFKFHMFLDLLNTIMHISMLYMDKVYKFYLEITMDIPILQETDSNSTLTVMKLINVWEEVLGMEKYLLCF